MDHLRPPLHHSPHDSSHWDGIFSREILQALQTDSNPHTCAIVPKFHTANSTLPKTNETKSRLELDEVDILEREFKANPKPTSQTKRKFADDMGVDLARINNWFQNRRAKRKQEKKEEAYDTWLLSRDASGQYSEPPSPNSSFGDHGIPQSPKTFKFSSGPPPSAAAFNPQYCEPTSESLESLHRIMQEARLAAESTSMGSFSDPFQELGMPAFRLSARSSSSDDMTLSLPETQDLDVYLQPDKSIHSQYYKGCNRDTPKIGVVTSGLEPSCLQSEHSNPFKSPPPPIDTASRRKKVQQKPAALFADALRSSRPPVIAKTVFHARELSQQTNSPVLSTLRRITSAAGNKNNLSGRVYKSGLELTRSSVKLDDFPESLMEQNYHNTQLPPSSTAVSSLNSSLNSSSEQPTPQAQIVMQPFNYLPTIEFSENQWIFDVPDEPIYTPAHDKFPSEFDMPQPALLTSMSQQTAPTFGQLNVNFMFAYESDSPQYTLSTQASSEYSFPGTYYMSPSMAKSKGIQFSHTTAIDCSEDIEFLYNTGSCSEDNGEPPQSIKSDLSPVPAEIDERNGTGHTTKAEGVKIKMEICSHSGPDHQEEVMPKDSSCASDTAELCSSSHMNSPNAIPISTLDKPKDERDSQILPVLNLMRQALVERIMDEFWIVFNQDWATGITQHSGGPPTLVNDKDSVTSAEKESFSSPQQKRQRSDKEDSPDESGNKKPRRQGGQGPYPSDRLTDVVRFACPFRKHDPQKYSIHSHRVCALTSWDTIARVKEHLYRIHKAAPYCKRCWKVFESEELLDSHSTVPASSICEAISGYPPEGVTPKQVAELRSKAKPYSKQNEADRWKEIFKLLFPGATVPSPYWEQIQDHAPSSPNSQVLASYEAYLHRELPRLFRSRVEEVVLREMQPVEANVLANLERLIRECQDQLSSGYREMQVPARHSEATPTQPAGHVENPANLINTTEHLSMAPLELDQQPSSDFFDAVLQRPPPQEDDYFLGFSTSDAEQFGGQNYTQPGSFSDSGYVSVHRCGCDGLCRCPISGNVLDNRDGDIEVPSSSDPAQDPEAQADDVPWRNWLVNRD